MTLDTLLTAMQAERSIGPDVPFAARSFLKRETTADSSPWYLSVMTGIGAWFAVAFMVAALGILRFFDQPRELQAFWGVLLIGVTGFHSRNPLGEFFRQAGLAIGLVGLGMLLHGTHAFDYRSGTAVLVLGLHAIIVFPFHGDARYRFMAVTFFLVRLFDWNLGPQHVLFQQIVLAATGAGLVACLTLAVPGPGMLLMARTLAFNLLVIATILVGAMDSWSSLLPGGFLLGMSALAAAWQIFDERQRRGEGMVWAAVMAVLLGAGTNPGLVASLMVTGLGFSRNDRLLTGMGLAFLPVFLVFLYYHLGWSLLGKSIALMTSGLLLLVFRKVFLARFPASR